VVVPKDEVAALQPVQAPLPPAPAAEVKKSTTAAATEAYPTDEPLAGLPGHGAEPPCRKKPLPGMQPPDPKSGSSPLLDSLASGGPVKLTPEAQTALQKRLDATKLALDRNVYQFKDYRGKALEDMKQLQTQKTMV
jgi:hypothetical protein